MRLLDYFRNAKRDSASQAKERLQVIIAHGRSDRHSPDYFPQLRQELLEVIKKYAKVDKEDIKVKIEREGNFEILELNVTLTSRK